ncbi:SRPBCC family protein [Amycolatopsis orientalis]|uniref:SRPBCC family protein n=1 Tax=Amycolatopsis orientalis TaxID=31958 RepID=UPI0003A26EC4|nr:SRPBCC family protein [Amycolatopsis orientalis]
MIEIDEEIPVPAPPERVWEVVSDPEAVVSCISGAELGASHDDGSFDGTLVVKFGAVRVRFGARVSLDLDEPEREGRLSAKGRDGQGATRFSAHATFRVVPDPAAGGSRVRVTGQVSLAGKLASLIEAGAGAVVSRMTKEFSAELVRKCAGEAATEPPARPSLWARLRDWWQRIVHKRQNERNEVRSGQAE